MGEYKKPLVTVDAGLAEGVYAASGAVNTVQLSDLTITADWGGGNGQLKFTADLSGAEPSQLVLVVTFNQDITNAWGDNASADFKGNTATFSWYSAPSSAELYIQVGAGISTLKIASYSYYNK